MINLYFLILASRLTNSITIDRALSQLANWKEAFAQNRQNTAGLEDIRFKVLHEEDGLKLSKLLVPKWANSNKMAKDLTKNG